MIRENQQVFGDLKESSFGSQTQTAISVLTWKPRCPDHIVLFIMPICVLLTQD